MKKNAVTTRGPNDVRSKSDELYQPSNVLSVRTNLPSLFPTCKIFSFIFSKYGQAEIRRRCRGCAAEANASLFSNWSEPKDTRRKHLLSFNAAKIIRAKSRWKRLIWGQTSESLSRTRSQFSRRLLKRIA